MTLVLPKALAADNTRTAHSHGAVVFGFVLLGIAFACAGLLQLDYPSLVIWPTLIAFLVIASGGVLIATMRRARPVLLAAAIVIETIGMVFLTSVVLGVSFEASTSDMVLLTFAKVSIVLFGAAAGRFVPRIAATIVAYVVAEGAVVVVVVFFDGTYALDWAATIMCVGLVGGMALLEVSRSRARAAEPALTRARIAEASAAGAKLKKSASSALLHDTVLNELSVIAVVPAGELAPSVREQISRSIRRLGESAAPGDTLAAEHGDIAEAVAEARNEGLSVLVAGDLAVEDRLSAGTGRALGLALRQCLANVRLHAGVSEAEISVLSSGQSVTVLVIDAGVGFVEGEVASDRRGLRGSVRERIEAVGGSVQIWTTPGAGTAISLTVPIA
jgi:signal transduction histidine kinase